MQSETNQSPMQQDESLEWLRKRKLLMANLKDLRAFLCRHGCQGRRRCLPSSTLDDLHLGPPQLQELLVPMMALNPTWSSLPWVVFFNLQLAFAYVQLECLLTIGLFLLTIQALLLTIEVFCLQWGWCVCV